MGSIQKATCMYHYNVDVKGQLVPYLQSSLDKQDNFGTVGRIDLIRCRLTIGCRMARSIN